MQQQLRRRQALPHADGDKQGSSRWRSMRCAECDWCVQYGSVSGGLHLVELGQLEHVLAALRRRRAESGADGGACGSAWRAWVRGAVDGAQLCDAGVP